MFSLHKTLAEIRREVDRERKEREEELRRMREQTERERMEKDREIADLRNKLPRASLASQVNKYDIILFKIPFDIAIISHLRGGLLVILLCSSSVLVLTLKVFENFSLL